MTDTIKYKSSNGYTGMLYGVSSFIIYDADDKECLHTGFRNINTYEELVKAVDNFPKFTEMLNRMSEVNK